MGCRRPRLVDPSLRGSHHVGMDAGATSGHALQGSRDQEHGHGHPRDEHEHGHQHGHEQGQEHGHEHGQEHGHEHGEGLRGRLLHLIRPHSHDPSQSTDAALESSADGVRAVRTSLVVLGVTALLQAVVAMASGSVALLADTVHNLSDALTAVPLWIAFVLVRRPPSRRFTYGLGRVEDLAGLFVVLMIAASALVAGWESLRGLADPRPVTRLPFVAAAGVIGFLGNEIVAVHRTRVGRRIGSAALVADGKHAQADGITSLGVVLGAIGVALGFPLADPLVGLVITLAIVVILFGALRDVGRRLLDGVDPETVTQAEQILGGVPGVVDVLEVKLRWIGHRLRADAVLAVDRTLDVAQGHDIATAASAAMRTSLPQLDAVNVHIEPVGAPAH
jgi:cation diffusion facilitator family transporter